MTKSRGSATGGDWGSFDIGEDFYSAQWRPPASGTWPSNPINLLSIPGRVGLRAAGGMDQYYVAESAALTVLVSSHTNYLRQGYVHLGLND